MILGDFWVIFNSQVGAVGVVLVMFVGYDSRAGLDGLGGWSSC